MKSECAGGEGNSAMAGQSLAPQKRPATAFSWAPAKSLWVACLGLARRLVQSTKQAQVGSREPG